MLSKTDKIQQIRLKIEELNYEIYHIEDQSHLHAGHQGFSDTGSHFHVIISKSFKSTREKFQAQKQIMSNFIDLIPSSIHALTLEFKD